MDRWSELPGEVQAKVLRYLPQQDKLSFMLASYDSYVLGLRALYRRLIFKRSSVIPQDQVQGLDFTLVGTSGNILLEDKVHELIFEERQRLLLESLKLNPELLAHVEDVTIFDHHRSTYDSAGSNSINVQLVELLKAKCVNLKRYLVFNSNEKLHLTKFDHLPHLETCMINHVYQLQQLGPAVKHLTINFTESYKNEIKYTEKFDRARCLRALYNLESLMLSSDEVSSYIFLKFLLEQLQPTTRFRFSTLKLIYYHGFNDYNLSLRNLVKTFVFTHVDLSKLEHLELILGCDDKKCDCLTEFVDELNCATNVLKHEDPEHLSKLSRLSVIQKTLHAHHDFFEKYDVALGRFVYNLPHPGRLKYLSIRHAPPLDGHIENNVEGNFLRRKKLYSHCFLKLTNLEVLISPSFMQSCACYEVITSDLLWNGCRCDFCEQHLALFDEFIITHNYYDETTGTLKDVITPRFFSVAGDSISKRLITYSDLNYNCSDLQLLAFPVYNSYWNFHSYFGFKHHDDESLCHFNQSVFKSLCQVISHFEESFVDDLNDILPSIKCICLSGIFYRITPDRSKFVNLYDSVPSRKNIVGPHDYVLPN